MLEWMVWGYAIVMIAYLFNEVTWGTVHVRIYQYLARLLAYKNSDKLNSDGLKFVEEGINSYSYRFYIIPVHYTLEAFKDENAVETERSLRIKLFRNDWEAALLLLAPCFPIIVFIDLAASFALTLELSNLQNILLTLLILMGMIVVYLNYRPRRIHSLNLNPAGFHLMSINKVVYYASAGLILFALTILFLVTLWRLFI